MENDNNAPPMGWDRYRLADGSQPGSGATVYGLMNSDKGRAAIFAGTLLAYALMDVTLAGEPPQKAIMPACLVEYRAEMHKSLVFLETEIEGRKTRVVPLFTESSFSTLQAAEDFVSQSLRREAKPETPVRRAVSGARARPRRPDA